MLNIESIEISKISGVNSNFPEIHDCKNQVAESAVGGSPRAGLRRLRTENIPNALKAMPDELVLALVKYGNNPDGVPALLYATKMGDFDAVKLLINHGADPFTRDAGQRTALYYALFSKNPKIVEFFLNKGINPNEYVGERLTTSPTWCDAIQFTDARSFELLIEAGLELNYEDYSYDLNSPLMSCIYHGRADLLQVALNHGGVLPRRSRWTQGDPVFWAISLPPIDPNKGKEKIECLKWLITKGLLDVKKAIAEVDVSVAASYPEFLEYMIDNDFLNVKSLEKSGKTLLCNACDNPSLIRVLISKGADVNVKYSDNFNSRFPLHVAAALSGGEETVKLLLSSGANVNSLDSHGRTPLFYAQENPKIKRLLIEHGAILKG